MKRFPHAHATHPQWRMAAALVLAQLRAQMALPDHASAPPLGLLYITDHYAADAAELLAHISAELPEVTDWAGTVGVGIAAAGVEYFDEPALAVMLCDVQAEQYRVFSGVAPLSPTGRSAQGFVAHTALLHADPTSPELAELVSEMADRTTSRYLFGGLPSGRGNAVQFAQSAAGHLPGQGAVGGVFRGGMSGVAFADSVPMLSRLTQGAQAVSAPHTVTSSEGHVVTALDGQPALDVLLRERAIDLTQPAEAVPRLRDTLVGLSWPDESTEPRRRHELGEDVLVRHLIGLDPARQAVAVAHDAPVGTRLVFCTRNAQAARADLVRVCTELREALEPEHAEPMVGGLPGDEPSPAARRMAGAVYVSCTGRGGHHFGAPSAELHIIKRALGDVPLVGFFAAGEIAHHRLYGYTGVLTVFVQESPDAA